MKEIEFDYQLAGDVIKKLRKKLGLNQEDFGKLYKVSERTIYSIEKGLKTDLESLRPMLKDAGYYVCLIKGNKKIR